ncbi:hypothetical protein A4_212 [Escherichia phage A4]|nr:hypothetical protein A4_212 [Escherichia phage A4]
MWVNVNSTELNEIDIFAFVNLETDTFVRGRLFMSSACVRSIAVMDELGQVIECLPLPAWAYSSTEEDVMQKIFEGINKLPGADVKNKIFNIENKNYSADVLRPLVDSVLQAALAKPKCIILKYIPELSLTKEDMKGFIFSSEL